MKKIASAALTASALMLAVAAAPPARADAPAPLDTAAIEKAIGLRGTLAEGVFRVTRPRADLPVVVDGFPITPRMGLAGWMAFAPAAGGAMLMGDLPVAADELQPVLTALAEGGVEVTALHNHFTGETPRVMFLHVGGMGDPVRLAAGLKGALDAIDRVRAAGGPAPAPAEVRSTLDPARLDAILRVTGEMKEGVYRIAAARPGVHLVEHGAPVGPALGFNSWAAFQGSADRAAVSGDVALLPDEVNDVVRALRRASVGVVAIHNHMLHEDPRIVFLHFWGVGPAADLARGIRAALDIAR